MTSKHRETTPRTVPKRMVWALFGLASLLFVLTAALLIVAQMTSDTRVDESFNRGLYNGCYIGCIQYNLQETGHTWQELDASMYDINADDDFGMCTDVCDTSLGDT